MGQIVVRIEGGEELLRKLKKLGVDVRGVLKAAALAGAEEIRVPANRAAPGPHVVAEVTESRKEYATVGIGPDEEHWYYRFMETGATAHEITGAPLAFEIGGDLVVTGRVGHPGMAARPFLRPAFDRHKGAAEKGVGEKLKKVIEP